MIEISNVAALCNGRIGPLRHPFHDFVNVSNKCTSRTLQRRVVDFAAERSFQNTAIDKATAGTNFGK